jgi:hypothetical protein
MEQQAGRTARPAIDHWDLAAVLAIAVGFALFHVGATSDLRDDPAIYLAMARDPLGSLPPAPFRFRVATPLLAAGLPFTIGTDFVVIGVVATSGTALIVRRTAERLAGFSRGLAAMTLFVGSSAVLATMRNPYATEPLSLLAGAAGLELARQRRWAAAGLALAAGVTVRETTLFLLLPLGAWCLHAIRGRRLQAKALAALAGPGAAVYLVLHRTPLLYGTVAAEHVQTPAEILSWNAATPGGPVRYLVVVLLGSLGLMWRYVPAALRSTDRYVSCSMLLLVPLILGTMIASDWPRILGFAVIVAAPAVAVVAPGRVLRWLVPTQIAIAFALFAGVVWLPLGVAAVFVAASGAKRQAPLRLATRAW